MGLGGQCWAGLGSEAGSSPAAECPLTHPRVLQGLSKPCWLRAVVGRVWFFHKIPRGVNLF